MKDPRPEGCAAYTYRGGPPTMFTCGRCGFIGKRREWVETRCEVRTGERRTSR